MKIGYTFSDVNVGEKFSHFGDDYKKVDATSATKSHTRTVYEFNPDDEVMLYRDHDDEYDPQHADE